MAKVRFELNLKGLNELMKGPAMQAVLDEKGAQIQSRAESIAQDPKAEYSRSIWTGNWISKSVVRADNPEAIHENLKNNTLLKAIEGGG